MLGTMIIHTHHVYLSLLRLLDLFRLSRSLPLSPLLSRSFLSLSFLSLGRCRVSSDPPPSSSEEEEAADEWEEFGEPVVLLLLR